MAVEKIDLSEIQKIQDEDLIDQTAAEILNNYELSSAIKAYRKRNGIEDSVYDHIDYDASAPLTEAEIAELEALDAPVAQQESVSDRLKNILNKK